VDALAGRRRSVSASTQVARVWRAQERDRAKMNDFLATTRSLSEISADDSGQVVIEWTLVCATVVIPLGLLGPGLVDMLLYLFYRTVGTIALPFP
jgi:hypothetical protein